MSTPEFVAACLEPFPPSAIGQLPRGGIKIDFVGHAQLTARLLALDPAWNWEPVAFNDAGEPLVVIRDGIARLWIRLTVGGVTRLGVGTSKVGDETEKILIGDALRNAGMRFGLALDLWAKEPLWTQESELPPAAPPEWYGGWTTEAEWNAAKAKLLSMGADLDDKDEVLTKRVAIALKHTLEQPAEGAYTPPTPKGKR